MDPMGYVEIHGEIPCEIFTVDTMKGNSFTGSILGKPDHHVTVPESDLDRLPGAIRYG